MISNEQFESISGLDLEPIKAKLVHRESGEGWSPQHAEAVEKEYRRFLLLMKLYPNEQTAPLVDVDTFWHYHILDTMKYAADCEQVFGYFLHHYPYVGMRGADDEAVRLGRADRMRALYESTFGESYARGLAANDTDAYCGAAAKAAYCGAARSACCGITANAAYCGAATKAAYCGIAANAAYCGAAFKGAAVGGGANAAYCGATAAAYCGANAKPGNGQAPGNDKQILAAA